MNEKKSLILILILVLSISITACGGKDKSSGPAVLEVNGDDITTEDFLVYYESFREYYKLQYGDDILEKVMDDGQTFDEDLREHVLNILILKTVVQQEAKKVDIELDKEEIEQTVEGAIEEMGGEEGFKEFLDQRGLTEEYHIASLENQLLLDKYREYYIDNNPVSDKDAEKYFKDHKDELVKVKVSHIIVEEEEDGKTIIKNLNQGGNFAQMAKEYSMDSVSANEGGELGYITKGNEFDMMPEVEETVFSMEVGKYSGLIESDLGYHIVRVEDRIDSFEELKDQIIEILEELKFSDHLDELQEEADVIIFEEELEAIEIEDTKEESEDSDIEQSEEDIEIEDELDNTDEEEKDN